MSFGYKYYWQNFVLNLNCVRQTGHTVWPYYFNRIILPIQIKFRYLIYLLHAWFDAVVKKYSKSIWYFNFDDSRGLEISVDWGWLLSTIDSISSLQIYCFIRFVGFFILHRLWINLVIYKYLKNYCIFYKIYIIIFHVFQFVICMYYIDVFTVFATSIFK